MKLSGISQAILRHREFSLLLCVLFLLLLTLARPTIKLPQDRHNLLVVVDISQSMNTMDMALDGKPVSRIAYTRKLLHDVVSGMPCGTRVALSFFAGASTVLQYKPIEVCENYNAIQDNIAHLEWRMAWSGNSRLRQGARSIASLALSLREPMQILFLTDGEEAPRLNALNTLDLTGFQGGKDWLVIGIGSAQGAPIPKYDENNKLLGYWSSESFEIQQGGLRIAQETFRVDKNSVAEIDSLRHISRLDETYLKNYSREIGGAYVRGDNIFDVISAISSMPPARRDLVPMHLDRWLATLAGTLLLSELVPRRPLQMMGRRVKRLVSRHG
jgi:mxaL protein